MENAPRIASYFSGGDHGDDLEDRVVEQLGRAEEYIRIMDYKLASPDIVRKLINIKQSKPKVEIKIKLDAVQAAKCDKARQSLQAELIRDLTDNAIDVQYVSDADKTHNKVTIIDDRIVLTGSFNYKHHERNQRDNLVIIEQNDVADAYIRMFNATHALRSPTEAREHVVQSDDAE